MVCRCTWTDQPEFCIRRYFSSVRWALMHGTRSARLWGPPERHTTPH